MKRDANERARAHRSVGAGDETAVFGKIRPIA